MKNNEDNFAKMALEIGGKPVKIIPSASTTINIFDLDKPEITEELLNQKEQDLRALLEEANKYHMQGSLAAVEYLDSLDTLTGLDDNPEWEKRVKKLFQEFAEQISIKNLRSRTGMSQSMFANYMEIPVRTLQEWEQGKRTPSSYIVKMIHRIIQLEEERKRDFTKKKVLLEQYTEKDYTWEQLIQIYNEKMKVCKKENLIIEFIAQKPILTENGLVIGVTTDFPAELNIYTYKVPMGVNLNPSEPVKLDNFFTGDIEAALGLKTSKEKSLVHPFFQEKEYEPYIGGQEKETSHKEIEQFIHTLNMGDLVVVEITNNLKKSIYFKYFKNGLFVGIDQFTYIPVKVPLSQIKSINPLE